MARFSDSTLEALGGFDKNVVIDELLYGEDAIYPITFFQNTDRTVVSVSGNVVTYTGGDFSVFGLNKKVGFEGSSAIYIITAFTATTITLNIAPGAVTTGTNIQTTLDLSLATFSARAIERVSDGIKDLGRKGIDLGNLSVKSGATELNLDAYIIPTDPANGNITLQIPDTFFADIPIIDTNTPPIYTAFVSYTVPASGSFEAITKKQRFCWIVRNDGVI